MQAALVGLSQSGKSTLFSAITEGQAHGQASAAHQADKAVVKVPDDRLGVLSEIYKPKKTTYATVEFLDLPGLSFVDESSRHEARRIIAQARQADMLTVVLRGFHDEAVAAYRDRIEPLKDLEELKNELLLADLELIENRIEKLQKSLTRPTPHVEQDKQELALMQRFSEAIDKLQPISEVIKSPEEEKLVRSFGFLSIKPMLLVVNVDEDKLIEPAAITAEQATGGGLVLSAKLEAELAVLEEEERGIFMEDMGVKETAKDRLLARCYKTLNLVSFLTVVSGELRAWTVPADSSALEAAGAIHSDIQRGFIRAETVHWDDYIAAGDMKAAKAAGKVRLEGKTYLVQDGDIISFRFNV
jgi:GTP-binding protein YchF